MYTCSGVHRMGRCVDNFLKTNCTSSKIYVSIEIGFIFKIITNKQAFSNHVYGLCKLR